MRIPQWPPIEYKQCSILPHLKAYLTPDTKHNIAAIENIDECIQHAYQHRIIFHLSKIYLLSDPAMKHKLHMRVRKESARQLMMRQQLSAVLDVFTKYQISCAVLKGILLNEQLYDGQCMRMSRDLDLLVPKNQLDRAHEKLLELGYVLCSGMTPKELTRLRFQPKDLVYRHPRQAVEIELHWTTAIVPKWGFELDSAYDHFESFPLFGNRVVRGLSKESNFVYLLIHATTFHWMRMQLIVDLVVFCKKEQLNWERIISMVKKMDAMRCLYEAIIILKYFEVPTPNIAVKWRDRWAVALHLRYVVHLWKDVDKYNSFIAMWMECLLIPSLSGKYNYLMTRICARDACLRYLKRKPDCSRIQLALMLFPWFIDLARRGFRFNANKLAFPHVASQEEKERS
jgi:hypothetical protein